jgi:YD repeat-containing protein
MPVMRHQDARGTRIRWTKAVHDAAEAERFFAPRPTSSTSPDGAVTNYTYTYGPATVTATTNGHWLTTTMDGFGRTRQTAKGDSNGTKSIVNTVYGSAPCAPLGRQLQVSQPYASGGTQYWTTYAYDVLGRRTSKVAPDRSSTTTYAYQGNLNEFSSVFFASLG